jgi:lipase
MRVLAVDLRGHASSTWDPPWSIERHVADLVATLDARGLDRPLVVGHSFGGFVALHLAAAAPSRVAGVVLLDPAGALDPARAAREAELARRDEGWADRDEARAARLALRPPHSRDTVDEDLDAFLEEGPDGRVRFRFSRPAVVAAWGEMARPAPSLAGYPGRVELLVAGRADYVGDPLREPLRRDLGDRLAEVTVDAGHQLFWDAPADVADAVRRAREAT